MNEQERAAAREQEERDLAALQARYGPPQPREPLPDQPALDLPGIPIYTARPPRKAKRGRAKKEDRRG